MGGVWQMFFFNRDEEGKRVRKGGGCKSPTKKCEVIFKRSLRLCTVGWQVEMKKFYHTLKTILEHKQCGQHLNRLLKHFLDNEEYRVLWVISTNTKEANRNCNNSLYL